MTKSFIKAFFLDIGGVLLTNGWDHRLREKIATQFGIEKEEMEERNNYFFIPYELGKYSFDEYLERIIFYKPRNFTLQEVKKAIFDVGKSHDEMINYLKALKKEKNLRLFTVSNEGAELAWDRWKRFQLESFIDCYIVSAFVNMRKPDRDIYYLAMNLAQATPSEIIYIDDRPLLVQTGKELGLHAILHKDVATTKAQVQLLV